MSEFVKKGALGGYKTVQGGQSDPECTHVILTLGEYNGLLEEIRKKENECRVTRDKAQSEIAQAKAVAESETQQAQAEAKKEVEGMAGELRGEREAKEYQIRLNENLLRITKERANADRKLKPKKEHTGYAVVLSSEKEYKYKVDRRNWGSVTLWETILQSPYSVDFTEEQAREQIKQELFQSGDGGSWQIGRIGIQYDYDGKFEAMIEDKGWRSWPKYNVLLTRKLRANYKAGYWELVFLHTKPLDVVPLEMRA